MKQGFSPVYDARTEILILGTAPSVKSLEKQQYYANPGNQFWNILFHSLAVEDPLEYSQRLELLKDHRIGLWDVYATFERKGSLDVNFSTIVPNDFTTLLTKARIKTILTNGQLAYKEALKNPTIPNLAIQQLPSTSGANNGQSKTRMVAWKEALTTSIKAK